MYHRGGREGGRVPTVGDHTNNVKSSEPETSNSPTPSPLPMVSPSASMVFVPHTARYRSSALDCNRDKS